MRTISLGRIDVLISSAEAAGKLVSGMTRFQEAAKSSQHYDLEVRIVHLGVRNPILSTGRKANMFD